MRIYDKDKLKWVPALLEEIDADILPVHYGGHLIDSDGDPKCPSRVIFFKNPLSKNGKIV